MPVVSFMQSVISLGKGAAHPGVGRIHFCGTSITHGAAEWLALNEFSIDEPDSKHRRDNASPAHTQSSLLLTTLLLSVISVNPPPSN